jgi:hypothetical protein
VICLRKKRMPQGTPMRPFSLESRMLTMGGVFYPKGYLMVMLPTEQDARQLERELQAGGYQDEEPMLLEPETILEVVGHTVRNADGSAMPSVGTEAATIHEYERLARLGQYGMMIHARTEKDTQKVMDAVHHVPFTYAQKYRWLVIEDRH